MALAPSARTGASCRGVTSVHVSGYHLEMSIQKVSFGAVHIQKLRRVALDEHLLSTLGLTVGDRVTVELDVESESIILRKAAVSKVDAALSDLCDEHAE